MYRKHVLAAGSALSFGVVAVIVVLIVHSGTAYAVSLAGVGGFTVEADEIRGYGAHIYVGVDDSGEREVIPTSITEMERSEIDGLTLVKTLDVESVPGLTGNAKIVVSETDTVTTDGQVMKATSIRADRATLRGQVIDESPPSDPIEQFSIQVGATPPDGAASDPLAGGDRPGLVLENATIDAHYLATDRMTFSAQSITIEYDPDGDGTYERTYGNRR